MTNTQLTPQEIYATYQSRIEVEQLANVLKNILEADKSYMQNDKTFEGWMFINHIASIIYYKIYRLLKEKNLLAKYSVKDLLDHLKRIKHLKIAGNWIVSEIPKKTREAISKTGIHIT